LKELQLPIDNLRYLFSYPNRYLYKGVIYSTLDSFCEIYLHISSDLVVQRKEVSRYIWLDLANVDIKTLAFTSGQNGLEEYLRRHSDF
jgi:NAD+ diphosphatase